MLANSTLEELQEILEISTACGLLDDLQTYCKSPDTINDFCDAVTDMLADRDGGAEDERGNQPTKESHGP
jgi:hypothetical protein